VADVLANGVRHHVQRLGAGAGRTARPATVVFVHGLVMDNLSSWYFTAAARAAQHADVILYDLRGHGKSERPACGYRIEDFVADLQALLDELAVDRPVDLVGNSFGGLLALAFARAHPDRVHSLVLVDAHLNAEGWGEAMAQTLGLRGAARDQKIAESFQSWLGRGSERKCTRLAQTARSLVYQTSLVADLRASPAVTAHDLAAIDCPTLALYGEASDIRATGEELARALPRCELRILPGCSHSALWEATADVREAILDWLATAPPLARAQGAWW
jgi:pimeloyl-ACP methyl ester carboxylesterase